MYKLRNLPHSALRHADAACRISMCLQLYQFWPVRQRCRCQPHSCCSDCDCACLIIYQSLCCEMNAGQTRGGSALRSLCSEWLSWASFKEDGVWSFFLPLLFDLFLSYQSVLDPFTLSPCLELVCFLFFLSAYYHISSPCIHSLMSLLSILFISLPSPSSFPLFPHPFRPLIPCHVGLKTLMQAMFCQKAVGMLLQSIPT